MIEFQTFGCKVNTYDTGLLQERLQGLTSERPVVVLNTCAVTKSATDEALRTARRVKRKSPDAVVVMTGCSAQVDTERLVGTADIVIGNSHKTEIAEIVTDFLSGKNPQNLFKSNIFKKEDLEPGGGEELNHTRSFLKIQDGCDSFCTFCVIPFARGKSRSLSVDELVERVGELVDQNVMEIVLTGVHIGDYVDQDHRLEDLIEAILQRTRVVRLRLTSLEPVEVSERLLNLYSDPRLCAHFHMSIQSANTRVLSAMKRKYGANEVEASLRQIAARVPQAFVGMDVIAGFPGETAEEFADTVERLKSLPWTRLHVFPYSSRPGTYATRLPDQIAEHEVARRAAVLRELSHERYSAIAECQIGQQKSALVLKGGRIALSRDYWSICFDEVVQPGREVTVLIKSLKANGPNEIALQGQLLTI